MAALIMGGIAAAGAVMGAVGGRRSSKAAKAAAYEQAAMFEMQMAETLRRTERQQAEQKGLTVAGAHASGVDATSGSTGRYVKEFAAEQDRNLAWMEKAGKMQAKAIRGGADAQRSADRWNIGGGLMSGLAGAGGITAGLATPQQKKSWGIA